MNLLDTRPPFAGINGEIPPEFKTLSTPCYLMDEAVLQHNAEVLGALQKRTGCKVLLAQKAFSNYDLYPIFAPHLAGTEASGLFEARLGAEEMPSGEVHVFCAAYREDEMDELLCYADHIVFNSPRQLQKFAPKAKAAGKSVGLRTTRSALRRRDTKFTIPVRPEAASAPPVHSGIKPFKKTRICPNCSTAFIFTRCASRMPTHWKRP